MLKSTVPLLILSIIYIQNVTALDLPEGIYCGKRNCYDVLNLTRESSLKDVSKAYRLLARVYHPDKHLEEDAKKEAELKFLELSTAYDVLKEEDSRKDYDYMLDNPDEMYKHYWRYYRRKVSVDVRPVVFLVISALSLYQYYAAWSKYNDAINYFLTVPKYRMQAQEIAKQQGLLQSSNAALKRKNRTKTKDQIKREEEQVLKQIIEEKMNIKGSCAKPSYYDVLWVQLLILPYTLYKLISFYAIWYYKFNICKLEYTDDDKLYIIRKNLKLSEDEFNQLEEEDKEYYLQQLLWKKDKFDQWKKEEDERAKAKLAESSQHKRYRRWMKKGGPGSITFLDD